MTGPAVPSNDELVALAQDTVLEGQESQTVADAIVTKFGEVQSNLNAALTQVESLKGQAMDETTRQGIADNLKAAKASSDQFQAVLNALVAPPAPEPEPEPQPEPEPEPGPVGRGRRGR